jgi:OPA family glycerol-3-phosphate transporter-like MFS transporter
VFVIPAGALVVMALVDFFLVKDRPSDAGHPDFPTGDEETGERDDEVLPFFATMKRVLSHKVIRVLAVAELCTGLVRQGLMLYWPEFLEEVHLLKKDSFSYQAASIGITAGGVAGALLCGYLSDYYFQSRRAPVAFIFYVGQAVSLLLLGLVGSPYVAAFLVPFSCMWIFGVHGMLSGTASMDFGGKKAAATAAGFLDGVQYVGGGFAGFGLGWLLVHYHWAIWPYAVIPFSLVGAILMLTLWNARPGRASAH